MSIPENRIETMTPEGPDGPMEPNPTAMVPVESPQQLAPYDPLGGLGKFWANWRLENEDDAIRVVKCFNDTPVAVGSILNVPIRVTHVLVHMVQILNEESGELMDCHRAVLVLLDGSVVSFVSASILKSLSLVCMVKGKGPWPQGLHLRVRQADTKSKRRIYQIDLLPEPTAPVQGKGKANGR